MSDRPHSEAIRERFVHAVEKIAAAGYPGATVVSIADSIGLKPTNFYRLKKPGGYPTLDNCVELCQQHGISPLWLFMGEGTMHAYQGKQTSALELLKISVEAVESEMKKLNKPQK